MSEIKLNIAERALRRMWARKIQSEAKRQSNVKDKKTEVIEFKLTCQPEKDKARVDVEFKNGEVGFSERKYHEISDLTNVIFAKINKMLGKPIIHQFEFTYIYHENRDVTEKVEVLYLENNEKKFFETSYTY